MKSSQLKFANPALNSIDFEIVPNSVSNKIAGILSILLIFAVIGCYLTIAGNLPDSAANSIGHFATPFIVYVVFKLIRSSKKQLQNPMAVVKDSRAPIVYLRSFSDDEEDDPKRWDEKTSEELIATALKSVGPVLAVKDQRRKHKILGATRIIMGDNWQSEIEKLISISQFVIVEANYSDNLLWELELVKKIVPPERLIISFLSKYEYFGNDSNLSVNLLGTEPQVTNYEIFDSTKFNASASQKSHYEVFNDRFSEIFGVTPPPCNTTEMCFFYFGKNWKVYPVPLKLAKTPFGWLNLILYNPFSSSIATYFTGRTYKFHLPFWKIKRALMLILHDNGSISLKKYKKQIETEARKIEKNLRSGKTAQEVEAGTLGLAEINFEEENENKNETDPARSLLRRIDSFKPYRKTMLRIGAAMILLAAGIGVFLFFNLSNMRSDSFVLEATQCLTAKCTIEKCTRAVEIDPANPNAHICLADHYFGQKDYRKAITEYDRTIELDASNGDIYHDRAASFLNLRENFDQVVSDATKAMELIPDRSIYFSLRGAAYFYKNDFDGAIVDLRRAIELDKTNSQAFYYLGKIQVNTGDNEGALSNFSSAITLNKNNPAYLFDRGLVYFSAKNYDLSLKDFDRAVTLAPKTPEILYNRGTAYCLRKSSNKTDDYWRAISDFTDVISIDGSIRDAYCYRSFAYSKVGKIKESESDLKMCKKPN